MTQPGSFLGYESADLDEAIFSVIPAPYEATASYVRGQAQAPRKILDASSQIEDYDEESGISVVDLGVHCLAPEGAPGELQIEAWVKEQINKALQATAVPVILGGEGTVSLWGIETLLAQPKCDELSVLHIDANSDLDEADEDGENHKTVMRRALQLTPKPHICQVGVRALSREGFEAIVGEEEPIECFFMSDLDRASGEEWMDDVIEELRSPVYLSIDLTGFDPAVIPAVGHPEPGGLQWWPVLRLLKKVASRRRIAAVDITELCPREGDIRSDYAAARLAYKVMNYIQVGGKMLQKPGQEE